MSTVQLLSKSAHQNMGLAAGMMRPTRDYSALDKTIPFRLTVYSSRFALFLTFLSFRRHIQQKIMQTRNVFSPCYSTRLEFVIDFIQTSANQEQLHQN